MAYKVPRIPTGTGTSSGNMLIWNVTTQLWEETSKLNYNTGVPDLFTVSGSEFLIGSLECSTNILIDGASQIKFEVTELDTTRRFAVDTAEDRIELLAGQLIQRTAVSDTPYAVLKSDYYLAVDTTAAITISLPAANAAGGRILVIKDATGTGAGTNAITLDPAGADTTEVASIGADRGTVTLISDGTSNWEAI